MSAQESRVVRSIGKPIGGLAGALTTSCFSAKVTITSGGDLPDQVAKLDWPVPPGSINDDRSMDRSYRSDRSLAGTEDCGVANEISDLRLFVRMVAAGSLSETARRLNSSLPAMSRRLTAMEARLGARLVDRSTRRFVLTEEGSILHDRGVAILAQLDEAEAEVEARSSVPHGHIRVGAPAEIGRRRFAPLIGKFSKLYPRVTVELVLNDDRMDVIGDELDVGLHIDAPLDGSIIVRKLLYSRRVVCASPDYISEHGVPERPEELLQHDCIRLVRGRHVFDCWTFAEDGKPREVQVRGSLLTNNAEVMHDWALMGRGIVLKALWDIEDDLRAGRLVELLAPFSNDAINLYLTYPTKSHLPRRVRVFIDFMFAEIGETDGQGQP